MTSVTALHTSLRSVAVVLMTLVLAGCGHMMAMMHGGPPRPDASEFGLGPRASTRGLYNVSLEPEGPLATRRLQKITVQVRDAEGRPVDDARMAVDGGMPQHGHGLPTRPRMTSARGGGRYDVEGVRFNMGGWWEFKLAITAASGTDTVTFNLDL